MPILSSPTSPLYCTFTVVQSLSTRSSVSTPTRCTDCLPSDHVSRDCSCQGTARLSNKERLRSATSQCVPPYEAPTNPRITSNTSVHIPRYLQLPTDVPTTPTIDIQLPGGLFGSTYIPRLSLTISTVPQNLRMYPVLPHNLANPRDFLPKIPAEKMYSLVTPFYASIPCLLCNTVGLRAEIRGPHFVSLTCRRSQCRSTMTAKYLVVVLCNLSLMPAGSTVSYDNLPFDCRTVELVTELTSLLSDTPCPAAAVLVSIRRLYRLLLELQNRHYY